MRPRLRIEERPRVTTTMVVDNTAYISTSLKGKGSYIYDLSLSAVKNNHPCEGPVLDGLRRCQQTSIDVEGRTQLHRTQAKCGTFERCVGLVISNVLSRRVHGSAGFLHRYPTAERSV